MNERTRRTDDLIRRGFKRGPVPAYDRDAMVRGLQREVGMRPHPSPHPNPLPMGEGIDMRSGLRIWNGLRPTFVVACSVMIFIVFIGVFLFLQPNPVRGVDVGDRARPYSWLWMERLQMGRWVTMDCETALRLADGSVVECSPSTQLAVRMGKEREIALRRGAIRVRAARVDEATMYVRTPLLDVAVVGTVFSVVVEE